MSASREIVETLLQQHTPVTFQAQGVSMTPTIHDGDLVHVRPAAGPDLRRGSVILYRNFGRLILHRLVACDPRAARILATGDAALAGGDWIPAGDILGVAESVRHNGRNRRLDTALARLAGRLRHALRPLRRALWNFRQTHHAQTPDRWYK